jgi:hypothetical protein
MLTSRHAAYALVAVAIILGFLLFGIVVAQETSDVRLARGARRVIAASLEETPAAERTKIEPPGLGLGLFSDRDQQ